MSTTLRLGPYLKRIIDPLLRSRGFERQPKEVPTMWKYVRSHPKRDQVIEISKSHHDPNSVRFAAYVLGLDREHIGNPHFSYFKEEKELEDILQRFIVRFENEIFGYLDRRSDEIFYEPSLATAEKLMVSYRSTAREFADRYRLNLDDREAVIGFVQDFLYSRKQKNEVPVESDMESAAAILMSLVEHSHPFTLTLDEYRRSPMINEVGGVEETFLFPLRLVYVYWNRMDDHAEMIKNALNDNLKRVQRYKK